MIRLLVPLGLALALAGCDTTTVGDPLMKSGALGPSSLAGELIHSNAATPPSSKPGACWADAVTPAVFETDTEHDLLTPGQPATAGHPAVPAVYQTVTRQKIVQDRQQVWFRSPCPEVMTPEFIGTLQRALVARGYYHGPLTGTMDAPTRAALRRYQAAEGLDSEILSLGAARQLGLVTYDLGQPEATAGAEAPGDAPEPAPAPVPVPRKHPVEQDP
ncbi:MAG: peptidoglycan-binding protein [Rhodobacteraceae bacterium]|nr:peptidoglycan-binding protein [Paracoccaceae bacterium]